MVDCTNESRYHCSRYLAATVAVHTSGNWVRATLALSNWAGLAVIRMMSIDFARSRLNMEQRTFVIVQIDPSVTVNDPVRSSPAAGL